MCVVVQSQSAKFLVLESALLSSRFRILVPGLAGLISCDAAIAKTRSVLLRFPGLKCAR